MRTTNCGCMESPCCSRLWFEMFLEEFTELQRNRAKADIMAEHVDCLEETGICCEVEVNRCKDQGAFRQLLRLGKANSPNTTLCRRVRAILMYGPHGKVAFRKSSTEEPLILCPSRQKGWVPRMNERQQKRLLKMIKELVYILDNPVSCGCSGSR